MKKTVLALLVTIVLTTGLVGCSPATNPTVANSSTAAAPAPSTSSETVAPVENNDEWSKTITLSDGSTYPNGTVTFIAPFAAGGSVDLGIRLFTQYAAKYTDATMIVSNVTGASGLTGTQEGLRAPADGYTLWHLSIDGQYVTTDNSVCPFDVFNDMSMIGTFVQDDRVWVARADETRFTDGRSLIEYAKAHAGDVTVAASGAGTIPSISTYYLTDMLGVEMNVVGYGGSAEAKAAFLGGECDIMGCSVSEASAMLQDNQCKVLMSMTDEKIFDDVETLEDLGCTNITNLTTVRGLAMSSKTDPAIVAYWDKLLAMVCEDAEFLADAEAMNLSINHRSSMEFVQCWEEFYPIFKDIKSSLGL